MKLNWLNAHFNTLKPGGFGPKGWRMNVEVRRATVQGMIRR